MTARKPSQKKRRRERRAAARHNVTVEQFRARELSLTGDRRRQRIAGEPFEAHEAFRRQADGEPRT